MSALPVSLEPELASALARAIDPEDKLTRALEALGPIVDRDTLLLDAAGSIFADRMASAGARIEHAGVGTPLRLGVPDSSVDALVSLWSGFRGVLADEIAEAERVLRPGGRLLVVHDYGRDDVARLRGEAPEYGAWSRRNGPFLTAGFRIRVLHCWWTFETMEDARSFLGAAFGDVGQEVGDGLKRPRLSWKVAVYHRTLPGGAPPDQPAARAAAIP